jgi:predicted Rossmann-fold nucleotide-binding protein
VRAADAAVAIGGAHGTLSEIALALVAGLPVVGLDTWDVDGVEVADSPAHAVQRALALAAARRS